MNNAIESIAKKKLNILIEIDKESTSNNTRSKLERKLKQLEKNENKLLGISNNSNIDELSSMLEKIHIEEPIGTKISRTKISRIKKESVKSKTKKNHTRIKEEPSILTRAHTKFIKQKENQGAMANVGEKFTKEYRTSRNTTKRKKPTNKNNNTKRRKTNKNNNTK